MKYIQPWWCWVQFGSIICMSAQWGNLLTWLHSLLLIWMYLRPHWLLVYSSFHRNKQQQILLVVFTLWDWLLSIYPWYHEVIYKSSQWRFRGTSSDLLRTSHTDVMRRLSLIWLPSTINSSSLPWICNWISCKMEFCYNTFGVSWMRWMAFVSLSFFFLIWRLSILNQLVVVGWDWLSHLVVFQN